VETSPLFSKGAANPFENLYCREIRAMMKDEGFKRLGLFYGMKNQKRIGHRRKLC
jgi:hypothetical protein